MPHYRSSALQWMTVFLVACNMLAVNATGIAAEAPDPTTWEEKNASLRFFNADWPHILGKLADQTGSTLVMHEVPRGRLTRTDHEKYSRDEAVRILNVELQEQNFRILQKDQFLMVVHNESARTRYRPRVKTDSAPKKAPPREIVPPKHRGRSVSTIRPRKEETSVPEPRRLQPATNVETPIATASSEHVEPKPIRYVTHTIQMRNTARDVAKPLYDALKSRAKLSDNGPKGLPAFEVFESNTNQQLQFAVGIDVDRNELVVKAADTAIQPIERLLKVLDNPEFGKSFRIVADPAASRIGQKLAPQFGRMSQIQSRAQQNDRVAALWQQQGNEAAPQNDQPADEQRAPAQGIVRTDQMNAQDISDMVGRLRGDVTIESVPDLGVMILRGNQADVDAVMKIIRDIEQRSKGTTADVRLLLLQHVNSTALSQLLATVYERLATLRDRTGDVRQRVGFIPIARPNAVLILAPEVDMESILTLADELDKPVDPNTEIEVFRLEHAIAAQVATQLQTFYEEQATQGGNNDNAATTPQLSHRIRVLPDVRTNSVIVQARPNDLAEIALVIRKIDRDFSAAINKMQIFPLKHAIADELAETINLAISSVLNPALANTGQSGNIGGGQQNVPQELRDVKSVVLEFLTDANGKMKTTRSGLLASITVTADLRSNSLLVSAPEQTMNLMKELIGALDKPSPTVAEIKVFTLANSDAATMATLLETLFEPADDADQGGIQVAGAEDASSGLVPLRFSIDPRTNSVIAVGGADALQIVEAILLRLDETDVRQRETIVVKLRNAPALDVANAINQFLQGQRDLLQIDPELVSTTELLEREIIVVPETISNSLLISATPRYFEEIQRLVAELDQTPPQVVIQAMLVEVQLDNTDEFGVELGFQDDVLFSRSAAVLEQLSTISQTVTSPNGVQTTNQRILSQPISPGYNFNNTQPLGNNVAGDFNTTTGATGFTNPSAVGEQGLSNFSLGRVNGDLGFGGLVLSASSSEVSVLIRALAARRQVHILSRPQIRTLDNQLAEIQVGSQVPRINGFTTFGALGTPVPTVEPVDTGIILTVTPRINVEGNIVMDISAVKSTLTAQGVPLLADPATGSVIESPIIDITTARATVGVPNGQTVVLGGMITKNDDTIERKVPWLGDIPILGQAFRYDSTRTRRTELLIFLTPRVVYNDADSELIKQVESERMHFIESEAEKIHGPLFAIPGETAAPADGVDGQLDQLYDGDAGYYQPGMSDGVTPVTPVNPAAPAIPGVPAPSPVIPGEDDTPTTVVPMSGFQQTSKVEPAEFSSTPRQ
ncbi:secretin N-terminal domain-containing protein [Thalassoroseus pseudoceratinae]|uniref:secretin N-terminal domain-containing protein n=1 Tax=Thalassoroseus pseudoceratinae TaxID=2713176 RepID=UPI00142421BA|nr:secretin N-terminal domain-containing protein [Thalassoroseus pseudoceratinae]